MGLNRQDKELLVSDISARLQTHPIMLVAEYRGVVVADLTSLRSQARSQGVVLQVLKNTLVKKAIAGTQAAVIADHLKGPLLYAFSDDPVAVSKLFVNYAKANPAFLVKSGVMSNQLLSLHQIEALAELPSHEELLSMLLRVMQAPVVGFVRTLNELPTSLVRVLSAVAEQKSAA